MKLSEWLTATEKTPRGFAGDVGVSFQTLYRYLNGSRVPRPRVQARISELTGGRVLPNDWVDCAVPVPSLALDAAP